MNKLTELIAVFTVLVSRLVLFTTETVNFNHYVVLSGFRWHHFYTGAIVAVVGLCIPQRYRSARALGVGIGAGLMIDEITLPLTLLGVISPSYWSVPAFICIALCFLLVLFVPDNCDLVRRSVVFDHDFSTPFQGK